MTAHIDHRLYTLRRVALKTVTLSRFGDPNLHIPVRWLHDDRSNIIRTIREVPSFFPRGTSPRDVF
jgi:hypothetical protein